MSSSAILGALAGLAAMGAAGPIKIVTGKLAEDYSWTPLQFEIQGNLPPSTTARLRSLPGNEEVPCQAERTEKGLRLTWVAPRLAKDTEAAWSVELVSKPEPAKPRVAIKSAGETESPGNKGTAVVVDGVEITRLVHDPDQQKPYLYPILGPGGKHMTRRFPMQKGIAGEEQDHPHQRSLWLTHGEVGGVDFWSEGKKAGRIVQQRLETAEGGPVLARLVTENTWMAPDDKALLADRRTIVIYPLAGGELLIDFTAVLTPAADDVLFGDTKEGSFGIRLAESLKEGRGGLIVNARGARGEKEAWGKPAEWVDYSGKLDAGTTAGVAILDHPESFRHPTHWHVRGYGLFAANPFGYHDFYRDKAKDGSYKLERGKSMTFRYRTYFHRGDADAARVAEVYRGFATPPALHAAGAP